MRWLPFGLLLFSSVASAVCPLVTTTADNSVTVVPGSLRDCIIRANSTTGHVTITFDATVFNPGTIRIADSFDGLVNPAGITIEGQNEQNVIIDATATAHGVFNVFANGNVFSHLTLKNAVGGGFGDGAAISFDTNTSNQTISHVVMTGSTEGLYFAGQNNSIQVLDSVIDSNGTHGMLVLQNTTACLPANRSTIARSRITNNGLVGDGMGVGLSNAGCFDVRNNTFGGNSLLDLKLSGTSSRGCVISGNTFTTGPGPAIGMWSGANHNRISFNTISQKTEAAISIGDTLSTDNVVERNLIMNTLPGPMQGRGWGVQLYGGADRSVAVQNTIINSAEADLVIEQAPVDVVVRNNLLVGAPIGLIARASLSGALIDHNGVFRHDAGFSGGFDGGVGDETCDPRLDGGQLVGCAGCAIDRGLDLATLQPPVSTNDSTLFFGQAPDLGAFESSCTMAIRTAVFTTTPPTMLGCTVNYAPQVTSLVPVTFSLKQAPGDAMVDATTGTVTWNAGASATETFILVATNEAGSTEQSFVATCKIPPVFTSTPTSGVCALSYAPQVTSGTPVTYSLPQAPADAAFDPATGAITWRPASGTTGQFTLVATNDAGAVEQKFEITTACPSTFRLSVGCASIDELPSIGALLMWALERRSRRRRNPRTH